MPNENPYYQSLFTLLLAILGIIDGYKVCFEHIIAQPDLQPGSPTSPCRLSFKIGSAFLSF
jgi:hypothetical protein